VRPRCVRLARAAVERCSKLAVVQKLLVVLRSRALVSRQSGDHDAARLQCAESLRLAREAGDWRLEVIERTGMADLRWEMGEHDGAARDLGELLDALRLRPASDFEVIDVLSTRVAILGESGRADDAVAVAREAIPVMRRMPRFRLEAYAQLLWKLGQPESAARVMGALAAREREGREQRLINEARIASATLTALRALLPPERLAEELALGERLGDADLCALLAEALVAPSDRGRSLPARAR